MTASDIAAWVGAITGTLALGLEAVKWFRSGPRLRISVNPNMVPLDPARAFPAEPHLFVWVRNIGDAPTTLTTLGFAYYSTAFARIRRHGEHGMVPKPAGESLPKALAPGEQWTTVIRRGFPFEERARRSGTLVCNVWHTMAKRPSRSVVRFARPKDSSGDKNGA
jgi:hypothetical protein